MKRLIIFYFLALSATFTAAAQPYSGSLQFDGVHRTVLQGTLMGGDNIISGFFMGEGFTYTRYFGNRWSVTAGEQLQFHKQLYSGAVSGSYRLPLGRSNNMYFDGRFLFNRYDRWSVNETIYHISAYWESPYVDIRLGGSIIHYVMIGIDSDVTDAAYTEPPAIAVGFGVNIRPRTNPWNLGLFIRNYDEYYYENWNINWGIRFYAPIIPAMRLFGEFNVRPAGSMSQLATRYEGSLKLGLRYVL